MDAIEASKVISDEYSAKIIMGTVKRPKTALELINEFGIPDAACYRRIRSLESKGLIECADRRLTPEGKRVSTYRSLIRSARIYFEDGRIKARFEWMSGEVEDLQVKLSDSL